MLAECGADQIDKPFITGIFFPEFQPITLLGFSTGVREYSNGWHTTTLWLAVPTGVNTVGVEYIVCIYICENFIQNMIASGG